MRYGWLILFLLVVIGTGCGKKPVGTMARPTGWTAKWDTEKAIVTPSGLKYEDEKVGDGPEAKRGTKVSLQYTGRVAVTSQIFQTNVGKPLAEFRVGAKEALPGVDEGVLGMKVGGKRRLYVPPPWASATVACPILFCPVPTWCSTWSWSRSPDDVTSPNQEPA
jgi:hypothetical protein